MKQVAQYIAWALGLGLNVLVIRAMLQGSYRQYRLAFAYALALLFTTIIEIAAKTGPRAAHWNIYYWIDDVILNILVFCLVIAFIDEAARHAVNRPGRRWLILGAVLIGAISYLVHSGEPRFNGLMTLVSRDLNVCAVILDLILWSLLVTSRRPDRRLLLVSGGLGIQLTGAIIGEEMSDRFRGAVFAGALVEVLTYLVALYIWWQAFRSIRATSRHQAQA